MCRALGQNTDPKLKTGRYRSLNVRDITLFVAQRRQLVPKGAVGAQEVTSKSFRTASDFKPVFTHLRAVSYFESWPRFGGRRFLSLLCPRFTFRRFNRPIRHLTRHSLDATMNATNLYHVVLAEVATRVLVALLRNDVCSRQRTPR